MLASGPPAVARTMGPFSQVSPWLKPLVTPLNVTYMASEKEAALGLPQLGLRLLADSNSWNVNGKPQNWDRSLRILSHLASDNVLAQPSVHFSVGLLRTKFQVPNFPVYGNMVNKKIMYQYLRKVCREKVCRTKFLGKIRTRYPLHTPKIACSYTRPVTSLRHQMGQRVFWEGPKFFKLCPTHFSRGGERYFRGGFAPLVTGLSYTYVFCKKRKAFC